jgi:hypothetical protein
MARAEITQFGLELNNHELLVFDLLSQSFHLTLLLPDL